MLLTIQIDGVLKLLFATWGCVTSLSHNKFILRADSRVEKLPNVSAFLLL